MDYRENVYLSAGMPVTTNHGGIYQQCVHSRLNRRAIGRRYAAGALSKFRDEGRMWSAAAFARGLTGCAVCWLDRRCEGAYI